MIKDGRHLEDVALLLGALIVETHPFTDGNGRTSRFIYTMVRDGFDPEKINTVLGVNGREELDTALIKTKIDTIFSKKYGLQNPEVNFLTVHGIMPGYGLSSFTRLIYPKDTDPEIERDIRLACQGNPELFTVGILSFLAQNPEINTDKCTRGYPSGRRIILLQELLSLLPIQKISELRDFYFQIKKHYTEEIIDIFVNPDKPEYQLNQNNETMTLLDYFKDRIDKKLVLF